MTKAQQQVARDMKARGYELVRHRRHLVFRSGSKVVVLASTPKRRGHSSKNWESTVRKYAV